MPAATQTAAKSFPAKYAGICARTGEQFKPGDSIVRDGRGSASRANPAIPRIRRIDAFADPTSAS